MVRYLFKFTKINQMKYISHLDLMNLFQRAFRRAEIKIAYSQGFSPHPKFSIAHPLSLGIASVAEYMEAELINEIPIDIIKNKLNNTLPTDVEILECRKIENNKKSLAALVEYGEYDILFRLADNIDISMMEKIIADFQSLEEIIAIKKQIKKQTEKRINIKPFIYSVDVLSFNDGQCNLKIVIKNGSNGNLNPELLFESFMYYSNLNIDRDLIEITRKELYTDGFVPLSDIE